MRTTLDIDEDVLAAARDTARREGKTIGQVVSELARQALVAPDRANATVHSVREPRALFGFDPLPKAPGVIVTNERVNQLRDDEGV